MRNATIFALFLLPLILMAQAVNLPFNNGSDARDGQRAWRIDYMLVQDWNDTEFVSNQKSEVVYEQASEGAPIQINNFFWSTDHWVQNVNMNYIYNDETNLIEQTDHNGFIGTETTPYYKYLYTYDEAHHLTGVYNYQYANSIWTAYKRFHLNYEDGFLTSTVEWKNNFGNNSYTRYDYTYGTDNKLSDKTMLICTDSTNWVTTQRELYTYHANDYTTNSGFLNYFTHTFPITYPLQNSNIPGYSSYGMPLQIQSDYYIGGNWMTMGRNTYSYNANFRPTEYLEEVNSNGWMNVKRWTMTYDANNNPEYQTYQDWNGSTWDNNYRIAYFWNQFTANADETIPAVTDLNLNAYPSPFSSTFNANIASKLTQPVTYQLFNTKGQCLLTQTAGANYASTIEAAHLTNGIYFLKATQGNAEQTRKIIKIK